MICDLYLKMDDIERLEMDAKLLHAVHHSEFLFKAGLAIIQEGENAGLFEGVKIGREVHEVPTIAGYTLKNHDDESQPK